MNKQSIKLQHSGRWQCPRSEDAAVPLTERCRSVTVPRSRAADADDSCVLSAKLYWVIGAVSVQSWSFKGQDVLAKLELASMFRTV